MQVHPPRLEEGDDCSRKILSYLEHLRSSHSDESTGAIRNIRREANEDLKKKLKEKQISEDQNKNFEKNIQKLTDTNIENIEKILNGKEKEIIQI